jgi:putative DNA primase/helicase
MHLRRWWRKNVLTNVRDIAQGKWHGILKALGLDDCYLVNKHSKCPICGGKDRYRFDNKDGKGTYFCSGCGPGDGVQLVMKFSGMDFKEAAKQIEQAAGFVKSVRYEERRNDEEIRTRLRSLWTNSVPVSCGDPVTAYLAGRGINLTHKPAALRYYANLTYYKDETSSGKFDAMLALVTAPDGTGATLHRTYIKDGQKAPVETAKKLSSGFPFKGGAIRLYPIAETLGVAEGIETALASAQMFNIPTWATISAHGLETFEPPEEVKHVVIFGDNDANFVGQSASYALAKRLMNSGITVEIKLPESVGMDWADVCLTN